MQITLDVSQMAYSGTGVGRYTYELVQALLKLNSPHQFKLWAGVRRARSFFERLSLQEPWKEATWVYSHLSPKLASALFNHTPVPFEFFAGQSDLVHLSDWTAPVTRSRAVSTVHDLAFIKYPETVDPLIRRTQAARLTRLIKHRTTLLADSLSTKNDLVEKYHLDPSLIEVVYPGINSQYQPQKKSEIERVKNKYHLPSRFILSLGTQEPRKNLERLIAATSSLSLPLVIAGKYGWGKKLTAPERVQVLGFVAEADLPALYSSATVFAYPSLYEGFGFPVLEAMACGTPVVTSRTSSLPEVAGTAAVLVDPLDTRAIATGIEQALGSSEKMIKKGILRAKQFTWETTANKVLNIYNKLGTRY